MKQIISRIHEIIKEADNLIEFEERVYQYMFTLFEECVGEVFTQIDQVIKEHKRQEEWTFKRTDDKTIQFMFGSVQFKHTLMGDDGGQSRYPFDEWLGIRKYQRYSPLVEVKVAEMASESTYREVARVLKEWTPVHISHQTVGSIVKRVGQVQEQADKDEVIELEESASLPEGKKVDFLFVEADGVYVRETQRGKHHEVSHALIYEGWIKQGKRISLKHPQYIMTTQKTEDFWKEVQSYVAHRYSLEQTQVVTNSDGGRGYTADKFQEAFSQSKYYVLNQLDKYHIYQALNRALGHKTTDYKREIKKAIHNRDWDHFVLWMDTYESTLEEDEKIENLHVFRTYIQNNWERIFDWRDHVDNSPQNARTMGAMESNQRHITYRMKKRGMHWSKQGAEAIVKIKQGMLNQTLRSAYLSNQRRSVRKQRDVRRTIRLVQKLNQVTTNSSGVRNGSISLYAPHSSAIGQLVKSFK